MAVAASDVLIKHSVKTGSAGNSTAQADPNASLGKYISTTQVSTAANGAFDNITGAENAASTVDYRCHFVHNAHATLTIENVGVYLSAEVALGASVALAVDNIAVSVIGATGAQAAEIANETTAPSGVGTFSSPTTAGTALSLGTIPAGSCRAFWIRRTAANSAALDADGYTLGVTFDTPA